MCFNLKYASCGGSFNSNTSRSIYNPIQYKTLVKNTFQNSYVKKMHTVKRLATNLIDTECNSLLLLNSVLQKAFSVKHNTFSSINKQNDAIS